MKLTLFIMCLTGSFYILARVFYGLTYPWIVPTWVSIFGYASLFCVGFSFGCFVEDKTK